MRVMLNASALSGVIIFTVANVMGMNLGTAPERLKGNAGFSGSTFLGYPLFLTVRPLQSRQRMFIRGPIFSMVPISVVFHRSFPPALLKSHICLLTQIPKP